MLLEATELGVEREDRGAPNNISMRQKLKLEGHVTMAEGGWLLNHVARGKTNSRRPPRMKWSDNIKNYVEKLRMDNLKSWWDAALDCDWTKLLARATKSDMGLQPEEQGSMFEGHQKHTFASKNHNRPHPISIS